MKKSNFTAEKDLLKTGKIRCLLLLNGRWPAVEE